MQHHFAGRGSSARSPPCHLVPPRAAGYRRIPIRCGTPTDPRSQYETSRALTRTFVAPPAGLELLSTVLPVASVGDRQCR